MKLKWFSIGLGLGAVIALLTTPKTGAEARQIVQDKADDARRYAAGRIQEVGNSVHDAIDVGVKAATDTAASVTEAAYPADDPWRSEAS
jgi:gas vesicle protein